VLAPCSQRTLRIASSASVGRGAAAISPHFTYGNYRMSTIIIVTGVFEGFGYSDS